MEGFFFFFFNLITSASLLIDVLGTRLMRRPGQVFYWPRSFGAVPLLRSAVFSFIICIAAKRSRPERSVNAPLGSCVGKRCSVLRVLQRLVIACRKRVEPLHFAMQPFKKCV